MINPLLAVLMPITLVAVGSGHIFAGAIGSIVIALGMFSTRNYV